MVVATRPYSQVQDEDDGIIYYGDTDHNVVVPASPKYSWKHLLLMLIALALVYFIYRNWSSVRRELSLGEQIHQSMFTQDVPFH
jgi:hypothetical protein